MREFRNVKCCAFTLESKQDEMSLRGGGGGLHCNCWRGSLAGELLPLSNSVFRNDISLEF